MTARVGDPVAGLAVLVDPGIDPNAAPEPVRGLVYRVDTYRTRTAVLTPAEEAALPKDRQARRAALRALEREIEETHIRVYIGAEGRTQYEVIYTPADEGVSWARLDDGDALPAGKLRDVVMAARAELAAERERERLAVEAAEAAERLRLAAEEEERQRVAAAAAEGARLAAVEAERQRIAQENARAAERERLEREGLERQRLQAEVTALRAIVDKLAGGGG